MKLSTSTIQFSKLPIEQAVERIAKLGFDGIDIWSAHAGCPHLDDVLDRVGAEGLKKLLAQHQIKLFAFSVYRGGYRKYAKLLGEAGGGVAVRGSGGRAKPGELTAKMKAFLAAMKPDLELAEQYNSRIAIENHGGALLNTLDSFKAFVDLNQHPRLGIALAPYHVQGQKQSVPDAIRISGKQLLFFYAWQRAKGVQQLPGHGPADFTPWIAALAEAGYEGYVNPFMHHEPEPGIMAAALAKSKSYLEACAAKALGG
jgi:sugar phosphate isomerase/epimerase